MIKMNEEEIEKQLKLSKRQSKDERYDYLCSEFNAINYCINLEKYTNKLQQENKQLKDNWNMLKEHLKNRYDNGTESISYRQVFMEIREAMQVLEIAQELEKGDSNE